MADSKVALVMMQSIVYRNNALYYMDIRKNKKPNARFKKNKTLYCTILMLVYLHLPHKLSKVAHRG